MDEQLAMNVCSCTYREKRGLKLIELTDDEINNRK